MIVSFLSWKCDGLEHSIFVTRASFMSCESHRGIFPVASSRNVRNLDVGGRTELVLCVCLDACETESQIAPFVIMWPLPTHHRGWNNLLRTVFFPNWHYERKGLARFVSDFRSLQLYILRQWHRHLSRRCAFVNKQIFFQLLKKWWGHGRTGRTTSHGLAELCSSSSAAPYRTVCTCESGERVSKIKTKKYYHTSWFALTVSWQVFWKLLLLEWFTRLSATYPLLLLVC